MSRLVAGALVAALVAAACVAIATASERRPAHSVSWWRDRARANRRAYRVEHRRWLAEHAHRLRDDRAHARALARARHVQAHETPEQIIRRVFGVRGDEAVRVSSCETGGTFSPTAANGQYRGVFQMGSRERATYGDAGDVEGQARAAHRYFLAAGGWGPWECKP